VFARLFSPWGELNLQRLPEESEGSIRIMLKQIDCHGQIELGRVRKVNEDQFLIADLNKSLRVHQTSLGFDEQTRLFGGSQGKLLLVAEGFGGHAGGEGASAVTVDSIVHYILNNMRWCFRVDEAAEEELLTDLVSALKYCQASMRAEVGTSPRDLGATITLAYVIWPQLYVVHVGDSRCYLYRDGQLRRLTRDHGVTRDHAATPPGVNGGLVDTQVAEGSRWGRALWRCANGRTAELRPDGYKVDLLLGDTLLLCTDGLSRYLPNAAIAQLLQHDGGSREISQCLVDAAKAAGGNSDITVVIARFQDIAVEHLHREETEDALRHAI
jgi:protein phosphatase